MRLIRSISSPLSSPFSYKKREESLCPAARDLVSQGEEGKYHIRSVKELIEKNKMPL